MNEKIEQPGDLSREKLSGLILDMFHRVMVHHTLWFCEVEHQLGMKKALEVMSATWERSRDIQMKKLGRFFGFETKEGGIPKELSDMSREALLDLTREIGKIWIANDGVWFQSVEFAYGMNDAKRCNDSCWARFSPFEAWSIKKFLNLPEQAGLVGLKKALKFRLYSRVNVQSFIDEGENGFLFQMNQCRVQVARKRKGLDDYPCKSGGLVEYSRFAEAIDDRIDTECVGCPPDEHPDDWFCAWRFTLPEKQ